MPKGVHWMVKSPYSIGSQHATWWHLLKLRATLLDALQNPEVNAVLVTHGTDSMEEVLFFLYLTIPPDLITKPVVFTGSMLPSDAPQSDAQTNLADAIACVIGALGNNLPGKPMHPEKTVHTVKCLPRALFGLAMNGHFTPAPWVEKHHATALGAFNGEHSVALTAPLQGHLTGLAASGNALQHLAGQWASANAFDMWTRSEQRAVALFQTGRIELLYCHVGANYQSLTQHLLQSTVVSSSSGTHQARVAISRQTVVVAAYGNGSLPNALVPELRALLQSGWRVVKHTRVPAAILATKTGELTELDAYKAADSWAVFEAAPPVSLPKLLVLEGLRAAFP
ncbi:MAG: hypothetical protein HC848_03215 [Limnobacter sp.]|nr:hypothetical protein [Limnobacter sp.]